MSAKPGKHRLTSIALATAAAAVAEYEALVADIRRGHRAVFPRALRYGVPLSQLVSDLRVAAALGGEDRA